jgi:hypothetical protein
MPQHHGGSPAAPAFTATTRDRQGGGLLTENDPGKIGPYETLGVLGSGGMGRVYLGRHMDSRPGLAAIKVIRPEYAEDVEFRRRFAREAGAMARVQSDHTARLLEYEDGDLVWIAMEYIPGLSLSRAVKAYGPVGTSVAWRLAADVGDAIRAMSAVEVVHRDLKPSNVMLAAPGALVIDFGVSQGPDTSSITVPGQHLGTPAYASPEQATGGAVGPEADVFSLGSTLAYAVTGEAPFGSGSDFGVLHRVASQPPSDEVIGMIAAADPGLADLVAACLDKNPKARPTAAELIQAAETPCAAPRPAANRAPPKRRRDMLALLPAPPAPCDPPPSGAPHAATAVAGPADAQAWHGAGPARPYDASPDFAWGTPGSAPTSAPAPARPKRRHGVLIGGAVAAVCAAMVATVLLLVFLVNRDGTPPSPVATPTPNHSATKLLGAPASGPRLDSPSCPVVVLRGDTGPCVTELQALLTGWGLTLDIDAQFGPQTYNAVTVFQMEAGITVDGMVGRQTKAALYSKPRGPVRTGSLSVTTGNGGGTVTNCLDADTNTTGQNGQLVQGWKCHGGSNQKWSLYRVPGASNQYTLVNQADNLCLDADTNTAGRNGQLVQTWTCNGQPAQKWRLGRDSSGNHRLVNILDGLCLDAAGRTPVRNGQKMQGWTCNDSSAQSWTWQ